MPRPLTETHHLNGAMVGLGSGAEVLDLVLSSDYSAVRLSNLPPGSTPKSVQAQIHRVGVLVSLDDIKFKTGRGSTSINADIRVHDRDFALHLTRMAEKRSGTDSTPKLDISVVHVPTKCEFWPSEIQTKTVHCLWPKPTRSAWLKFRNAFRAQIARSRLCKLGLRIDGQKLQSTLGPREAQPDNANTTDRRIWVHLTNLNLLTTQQTIRQYIPYSCQPLDFRFGRPSHLISPSNVEESIKRGFEEIGPLDAWDLDSDDEGSPNIRANVFYRTAKDARTAVNRYNGQLVPLLPEFRLYVVSHPTVEFEVPRAVYRAIETELREYNDYLAYQEDYVRLFSHRSTQSNMATIGVYGEYNDPVACVKREIETVLRGHIAMDGEAIIWDKFFATDAGLQYLTELSKRRKGYIRRNLAKSTLALYGQHEAVELMEEDLLVKVKAMSQSTQIVTMCYEDQIASLEGGFRAIVFTLGKQKARYNMENGRIVVKGSQEDLENAGYILENHRVAGTNIVNRIVINIKCPVCLTNVEDPYQLGCGHWYCTECLESQCTHATDFPIQCLGCQGKCSRKLGLPDLKAVLSTPAYSKLIEASLSAYVKKNFLQHCPTPDCQEIHRPFPGTLDCPQCLHSICTSCHDVVHDDKTCEEHQRFVEKDKRQLEEWKRTHGVKQCPKCEVSIEKEGCNKVRCGICKTPFCWVCLAAFGSEPEVYGHMTEVHGSWVE